MKAAEESLKTKEKYGDKLWKPPAIKVKQHQELGISTTRPSSFVSAAPQLLCQSSQFGYLTSKSVGTLWFISFSTDSFLVH